ncbi:hypothetical protein LQ567_18730 [Niabella pedocola]|uniref:Uncharacterized protein n=1 Tax=Niabella pedocola TaxID=1752077 RepID=A0ABS8PV83_9BACT|nr:hypothetical protein [Niabella pedocola]MCD2424825.1 hypothetical protein [Niabella pedocola]
MKSILLAVFILNSNSCTPTTVYICDSNTATWYHYNEHCRGLKNCNYRIIATTLDSAENSNRTLCRWED